MIPKQGTKEKWAENVLTALLKGVVALFLMVAAAIGVQQAPSCPSAASADLSKSSKTLSPACHVLAQQASAMFALFVCLCCLHVCLAETR